MAPSDPGPMHRFQYERPAIAPRIQRENRPHMLEFMDDHSQSAPNTSIFTVCTPVPFPAEEDWYEPITSKEWIAVMTLEAIPSILRTIPPNHATSSALALISPVYLSPLRRMKEVFSRAMATARFEADNGAFIWPGVESSEQLSAEGATVRLIRGHEVLSSTEVEVFLARIEEVRHVSGRVVLRRYWRIEASPELIAEKRNGGVVSAGSKMEHHLEKGFTAYVGRNWDYIPKVLVAEFQVDANGISLNGFVKQA